MSKTLGITVLAIGVGVLGWWASSHNAPRIEQLIAERAETEVKSSVHGAKTRVSGRDIVLSGVLDGPEEESRLLAALDALPGRRVVISEATVLPVAAPFGLEVVKDGSVTATGNVPTEALRGSLGLGDQAAGLVLAAGAPAGWADLARAGITALAPMTKGAVKLSDNSLTLTGEVLGPDEAAAVDAALAGLPEAAVTKNITLLDDGTPANYTIDYNAVSGATVSGKLPKGVDLTAIAAALGLGSVAGDVTQGLLGPEASAKGLAMFQTLLGRVETLRIAVTPDATTAKAEILKGTDATGFDGIDVLYVTPQGANGDTRVNAATGAAQRLMGGFWLDRPDVEISLAGCQSAANGLLAANTINFVSGSDELDTSAVAVINQLAGIMARCSEEAGLRAVIGGYTDSSGDAVANLGLSQRRAIAVRRELITRGVMGQALKSIGFGDADPIADNATEEGRAKNRRTTITWSQ